MYFLVGVVVLVVGFLMVNLLILGDLCCLVFIDCCFNVVVLVVIMYVVLVIVIIVVIYVSFN